jgi:hypothetical protein
VALPPARREKLLVMRVTETGRMDCVERSAQAIAGLNQQRQRHVARFAYVAHVLDHLDQLRRLLALDLACFSRLRPLHMLAGLRDGGVERLQCGVVAKDVLGDRVELVDCGPVGERVHLIATSPKLAIIGRALFEERRLALFEVGEHRRGLGDSRK